jgi:GTPase SAR1 family protein
MESKEGNVGWSGKSGKTALANNMMGKRYQGKTKSTIGAEKFDKKIVCGKIGNQSLLKEYSSPSKELEHLVAIMTSEKMNKQSQLVASRSDVNVAVSGADVLLDVTSMLMKDEKMDTRALAKFSIKDDLSSATGKAVSKQLTLNDIDTRMIKHYSENISTDPELIISLYDSEGQDIFNVLHPFSCQNLEFMWWCLIWNYLYRKMKRRTCMKHLKFWMNSIVMHAYDEVSGKTAAVAIVGTRKDKTSRLEDHDRISLSLAELFSSSPVWSSLLGYREGGRSFESVSCEQYKMVLYVCSC